MDKNDDKRYETTGRVIFSVAYLTFAIKCTVIFSLVALAVLWFFNRPLWYAPLLGVAAFFVYRFFRRLFFRLMLRFTRWANDEK
ncbi:MAG: hypothetical protein K5756_10110 [Clostridiales bacterium]|nr:hypothetical protein [Clostridiales bacterium]